jgi:hypothetical protein
MPESMVLLSSHLLIPILPDFVPSSAKVHGFFDYLVDQGTLRQPIKMRLRVPSDEDLFVMNANTGERIVIGKRLRDIPVSTLAEIEERIHDSAHYVLALDSSVPVSAFPFDLREKDGAGADPSKVCELHLSCILRDRRNQLSEPWHEHLRTFLLPKEKAANACSRCGAIHTPEEEVQPRFWIQFDFGEVFFPGFKDSGEPMHPGTLDRIEQIFDTQFFHGRFFD